MTDALQIEPTRVFESPFQHLNTLPFILRRDYSRIGQLLDDRSRQLPPIVETFRRLRGAWESLEHACAMARHPYDIFCALSENHNLIFALFALRFELLRADVSRLFPVDRYLTDVPGHFEVNIARALESDYAKLIERDVEYNASWKRRGGVGAFMMLARKWDRLEPMVALFDNDLVRMLRAKPDRLDDVEDLRRYLELVEAEYTRTLPST